MSVIVTAIIVTHEGCSPLLFLIGGEDNATPNFYSEEMFPCPSVYVWKGKTDNKNTQTRKPTETKHVIAEILHNFNLEGARVQEMCLVESWLP